MASQRNVGNKTKQELLEYINKVRVVITDNGLNCVHVYNDDNKGSSTMVTMGENENLSGRRMHCNDTFIVVALFNGVEGGKGGYMIGNVDDFTKNQSKIVNLSYDVCAIFITNDNKVALGGYNGNVQFDQVDVNGKQTMIWCKKIHEGTVNDIEVQKNRIFTASNDKKCGVITMSDGSVLHMFNATNCLFCVCVVNDAVILTGCYDGHVYLHDMSTTTTSVFVTPGGSKSIYTLALSNDYNILYCGGGDSTLYAINIKANNTLVWKLKCENTINSVYIHHGIICVAVACHNVVCVNEHNGDIITALTIKPQGVPYDIFMIPPIDPHKQCKERIQQLKHERDATKQQEQQAQLQIFQFEQQLTESEEQGQRLTRELDAIKQIANKQESALKIENDKLKEFKEQIIKLAKERDEARHQAQQRIDRLSQEFEAFKKTANQSIAVLEMENNHFKQDRARDQLTALITKINKLSEPEVIQIANVYNINLTDIDLTKLATSNILAHASFDEFFEELDVDSSLHDSLLHLFSVIKRAQEIGQFPVEHPIAPWIAQQGQPDIAARFDELNYTEEMFVNVDSKVFAGRCGFMPRIIKKLQTDFITCQTSVLILIKPGTSSEGVILMPFNPNIPKPSASSS